VVTVATNVVTRLRPDGTVDAAFGAGGTVTLTWDGGACTAVLFAPDGKIYLGGARGTGAAATLEVARLNADGSRDTAFDDTAKSLGSNVSNVRTMKLHADGRLLVAALVGGNVALLRLTASGAVDAAFGTSGRLVVPALRDMAIEPDGSFVRVWNESKGFRLARHLSNGQLDAAFGTGGEAAGSFGSNAVNADWAERIVSQPDGRLVVMGTRDDLRAYALARFWP
jgi:uncharacterized delta-60 repeat protein